MLCKLHQFGHCEHPTQLKLANYGCTFLCNWLWACTSDVTHSQPAGATHFSAGLICPTYIDTRYALCRVNDRQEPGIRPIFMQPTPVYGAASWYHWFCHISRLNKGWWVELSESLPWLLRMFFNRGSWICSCIHAQWQLWPRNSWELKGNQGLVNLPEHQKYENVLMYKLVHQAMCVLDVLLFTEFVFHCALNSSDSSMVFYGLPRINWDFSALPHFR